MAAYGPFSLDRMVRAVEKVRQRLLRATAALERAGVPYAVAGGNAVAAWVTRVDESAVRNTRNVDIPYPPRRPAGRHGGAGGRGLRLPPLGRHRRLPRRAER
jgi:hypothetical protein